MTPCYICGGPVSELRLDPRDMKTRPCLTCESIIADAVDSRKKQDEENDEFAHVSLEDYLSTKRKYNDVE